MDASPREARLESLWLTSAAARATKVFGSTYGLLTFLKCLKLIWARRRHRRSRSLLSDMEEIFLDLNSIKISTFVAAYPTLYKLIRRFQRRKTLPQITNASFMASLSISPLVLLLPSSVTTHLNLYSISGLSLALLGKAEVDGHLTHIPRWLKEGGGWWLFPITQGWLIYLSVFEPYAFPDTYRRLVVNRSTRYLPSKPHAPSPNTLITLLPLFTVPPYYPNVTNALSLQHLASFHPILESAHSDHVRALCATLHPDEPGCVRNAVSAVAAAWPGSAGLVGGYTGLIMLLRGRKALMGDPKKALLSWVDATVRGASLLSISISTAWAMTCLFQHVFPPSFLPRARFSLGGFVAGLWIFLVPSSRRLELGMYAVRVSLLSGWRLGLSKGWWRRWKYMHGLPFVACLAMLLELRRRDKGAVDGWVGRAVGWLEKEEEITESDTTNLRTDKDEAEME